MKNGFEAQFIPTESVVWAGKGPALVLAPHPDDEVIGCGGAIIKHVQNNDPVHVIIMTDGAQGDLELAQKIQSNNHYELDVQEYIELRKKECQNAGIILNYGIPKFWGIRDRTLEYGEKFVLMVLDQIDALMPSYVYVPSLYEMHPDHRTLAMIALEAVRRSKSCNPRLIMYEIGRPIPSPNLLLDITDVWEQKLDAVNCFKSQLRVKSFDEYVFALNRFRAYTLPQYVKNAEAYLSISIKDLKKSVVDIFLSESEYQKRLGLCSDIKDVPLVSVIIRTIGNETLFKKALDSIALQTYLNIEILVVDAKGDNSIKIPEWCGRFAIKVCCKNKWLPRSEAANLGLDNAKGKYIILLDEDDWFFSDHISKLVSAAQENLSFQVFYSGTSCIDIDGNYLELKFSYEYDPVLLLAVNYIPIHSVLFDIRLVHKGCRFDETLDIYEDWDFWLQLSQHTSFYHVRCDSAIYRININSGSKVHDHGKALEAKKAIFSKWMDRISLDQYYDLMEYVQKSLQLEDLTQKISEGNSQIAELNRQLSEKELNVNSLNEQNIDLSNQASDYCFKLSEANRILDNINNSKGFRFYIWVSTPIRFLKNYFFKGILRRLMDRK